MPRSRASGRRFNYKKKNKRKERTTRKINHKREKTHIETSLVNGESTRHTKERKGKGVKDGNKECELLGGLRYDLVC